MRDLLFSAGVKVRVTALRVRAGALRRLVACPAFLQLGLRRCRVFFA